MGKANARSKASSYFSSADALANRSTKGDQQEGGSFRDVALTEWLVNFPNLLLGLVLATAGTCALISTLSWMLGEGSQLSAPANFRLDDQLTSNAHVADLVRSIALQKGQAGRLAISNFQEQQTEPWHALNLLYVARREGPNQLDLLNSDTLARMRQVRTALRAATPVVTCALKPLPTPTRSLTLPLHD